MNDMMREAHDRFNSEFMQMFSKLSSQENWPKECVETMKDLLKCVYYIEVLDAMHNSEHEYDQRSYTGYRPNSDWNASGRRYGGENMSGRRYYDDGKESAIQDLTRKMEMERNPDIRAAYQKALEELRMR